MLPKRIELHNILTGVLGSVNVYFQPPGTVKMRYPCIVYARSQIKTEHADNLPYSSRTAYKVTVIDANPDSDIPAKVGRLTTAKFDRHYTSDNLNHDVYNLFY